MQWAEFQFSVQFIRYVLYEKQLVIHSDYVFYFIFSFELVFVVTVKLTVFENHLTYCSHFVSILTMQHKILFSNLLVPFLNDNRYDLNMQLASFDFNYVTVKCQGRLANYFKSRSGATFNLLSFVLDSSSLTCNIPYSHHVDFEELSSCWSFVFFCFIAQCDLICELSHIKCKM